MNECWWVHTSELLTDEEARALSKYKDALRQVVSLERYERMEKGYEAALVRVARERDEAKGAFGPEAQRRQGVIINAPR